MHVIASNIWKKYSNSLGHTDREVLRGLDLTIKKGEKIAIMGPSGSGKTTLLNLLGTLDKPDKGSIDIGGRQVSAFSQEEVLRFRSSHAGFVFQFHHLLPQCNLLENVLLPTLAKPQRPEGAYRHAEELLRYLGIWDQRHQKPAELSGGECQRTAVARALINKPDLLLADEPTGSLDKDNARLLIDMLIRINEQMNITLIMATHADAIANKMDKVYHLESGVLQVSADPGNQNESNNPV